ncbi:MAG: hypothetical protein ACOYM3_18735 [Terrimicrobiaceae bacterium]
MKATVKCSNCGAEITNLNFSWPKKQWLFILPILLLGFLPMWRLYKPKGDFRQDLQISVLEKRQVDKSFEILGTIENRGKTKWENINIDCLFFDANGTFIDKTSGRVDSVVMPSGKEYFKITAKDNNGKLASPDTKLETKIAGAYSNPF